mgnify:CR=1 FL=1
MANQLSGVADTSILPGTVLNPNSQNVDLTGGASLDQFGTELEKTGSDAGQVIAPKDDPKRMEYWQSKAQSAEDVARKLGEEVNRRKQFDPLIDLVRKDETVYRVIQDRLNGKSATTEKLLEAPQRPSTYSEVEAYSNPESASFKYRQEKETYQDTLLQNSLRKVDDMTQMLARQKDELQQKQAQQEAANLFRKDVVSKGILDEEFDEFFGLVNNAKPDDLVDYYKWKKTQPGNTNQDGRFARPEPSGSQTRQRASRPGEAVDIGKNLVDISKSMF